MQKIHFPTEYKDILQRIDEINPVEYARSRNYVDGSLTYLSPYISRGVISVKQIRDSIIQKGYSYDDAVVLIKELAWREYFQRIWQCLEDDMFDDIRRKYTGIKTRLLPAAIADAKTGIESIDNAIKNLYATGYMHNHLRMYVAGLACNIGKAYWQLPSQWLYYHLLDGDLASNTCSWQWVAGNFSSKQYIFNQENVNKYTHSNQQYSFVDKSYDDIAKMDIPDILTEGKQHSLTSILPATGLPDIDHSKPLLIYNSYNLDPAWRNKDDVNRLLLLEPSHFKQFPVNEKVINFILRLSRNIAGLKIFTGEVNEITGLRQFPAIYSKEHPCFKHYPGLKDQRDWMFPEVKDFHHSFHSYWKKCEKHLHQATQSNPELIRA
jgi:deoxyribodipyrimidine photo-lyase